MLDDGSSLTLLEDSLIDELNLSSIRESLCIRWTGDIQRVEDESRKVTFEISAQLPEASKIKLTAQSVKSLDLPLQTIDVGELAKRYTHLEGVPLKSFKNARPRLLIGMDHAKVIMMTRHKYGGDEEPIAGKCQLGWVLFGSRPQHFSSVFHIHKCDCHSENNVDLDEIIKYHYSLESIGISAPHQLPISRSDERALDILKSTTVLKTNRYELGLLWKFDEVQLPPSYNMAVKRLQCLEKQCERTSGLTDIINGKLQEYLEKGYARKASQQELSEKNIGWHLPIFIVQNSNKPGKVRLVWDAAATVNSISLNSVLLKGVDQLISLPGILQRFRERKVGITGDIQEMYHQVQIRAEDQKYQKFLWRPTPSSNPEVYVMQVMTFGATCSPSCAQYIKNINADRFIETHPLAVECIKRNHYVDDMWRSS